MGAPDVDANDLELELEAVSRSFARDRGALQVIDRVDITLERQGFLAIVGPNGCGKTTLLRMIAGLLPPSEGTIRHRGRRVVDTDRSRLLVFQQPTLFPWMTLHGNVAFALKCAGSPAEEREPVIRRALESVGLAGFEGSYPGELSGGMVQRAEFARALAVRPTLLLMDEPFAAVDALSRLVLQEELARVRAQQPGAIVMVTHDVREAVFLADRVAVISRRPGRLKCVFDVPHDGPRDAGWRADPAFGELCERIVDSLREEMPGASRA